MAYREWQAAVNILCPIVSSYLCVGGCSANMLNVSKSSSELTRRKMNWFGHGLRRNGDSIAKQALQSTRQGHTERKKANTA